MHILTAFLTAAALVFPLHAGASTVTTNLYYSTSVNGDIADSCKDISVASSTGVVSAKCNHYAHSHSEQVISSTTTLDVDDVLYCKCDDLGSTSASLTWGTGSGACTVGTYVPTNWTLGTSTDGKNYIIGARCTRTDNSWVYTTHSLDLGDTSDGLQNSSGSLAGR